mgnify:CR=1 FL=1
MSYMFRNCSSLKKINISNFSTRNVKNINSMFSECKSLKEIYASNFYIGDVPNNYNVFSYCPNEHGLERKYKNKY